MVNNAMGAVGENKAAEYLVRHGYKVLEKNFRCRAGEIDIIACKGNFVVFTEVKFRKNAAYAEAKEYVTYAKQQRIIKTAMLWLSTHECDLQPRFDVIEVYPTNNFLAPYRINHLENAFM